MIEESRPADREDLGVIVELATAMRDELTPMRGGRIWSVHEARRAPLDAAYDKLLDDPDACVVVGTIDDTVIGFGAGRIEPLADGTRLGVVEDLFVDPEARAVGVGEAMLEDLVAFFTAAGCVGIDSFALPGHRATKNFFEESGFTARAILMHHSLREPEA